MGLFSIINEVFSDTKIDVKERLDTVETCFDIVFDKLPSVEIFNKIIENVPKRDSLKILLMNDSDDMITLTNDCVDTQKYSEFIAEMQNGDNIKISIQIDKTVENNIFSIYSYETFSNDLLSRPVSEIMRWFSSHLSTRASLIFEVFDYDISLSTKTIAFMSTKTATFIPSVDRISRLEGCKSNSSFYNMNLFELIPDDFIIQGVIQNDLGLQPLFNKIATILSIAYVSSSSSLTTDIIHIQINGQRTINYEIPIDSICGDEKWQNIYTWIYTDGNSTDKTLIVHNVITLYCKYESILYLDDTVFEAIKTNYNLYLRNNVDQYINLKRDIAKFIKETVGQVGEYATSILTKFKNNLLAIFGFLFTVVLTRIGNAQKWENIFTKETIYVIEIFVIGSFFYLIICIFETRFKIKKSQYAYFCIKDNYKGVLSAVEIEEAFDDDKLLNETKKCVIKGIAIWSIIWGITLISAVIIIECLTTYQGLIVWMLKKLTVIR